MILLISTVIILAIGVDTRLAINLDNGFIVADTFILKGIFVAKVKLLMQNQEFYIKIGAKPYRKLSYYLNTKKKKNKSEESMSKITISKMSVKVSMGIENEAFLDTVMWGGLEFLLGNMQALVSKYVKVKNYENIISPSYTDNTAKVNVDIKVRFSLLKVLGYLTFNSKKAKNEQSQVYEKEED